MTIGLHVIAQLDEEGCLSISMRLRETGAMTADEVAAKELVIDDSAISPEMLASRLEQLAFLVPVTCLDCGVPADVSALVTSIRRKAVLQ